LKGTVLVLKMLILMPAWCSGSVVQIYYHNGLEKVSGEEEVCGRVTMPQHGGRLTVRCWAAKDDTWQMRRAAGN
jgi:hypothetical protein